MTVEKPEGFPDPDDFPDYSDVDSRTVLDPDDSFDESAADFSEPEGDEH